MTEFTQELRHYCRNPKCRMKLAHPELNQDGFCCKGCYRQFYRFRCLVCEEHMERKTERQLICGKRACRNALEAAEMSRNRRVPSLPLKRAKNVVKHGVLKAVPADRGIGWAIRVNKARIISPRRVLDRELP